MNNSSNDIGQTPSHIQRRRQGPSHAPKLITHTYPAKLFLGDLPAVSARQLSLPRSMAFDFDLLSSYNLNTYTHHWFLLHLFIHSWFIYLLSFQPIQVPLSLQTALVHQLRVVVVNSHVLRFSGT